MTVNGGRFVFVAVCLLICGAQIEEAIAQTQETIAQQCLDCICQAASGCDSLTGCKGDVCGPYRITQPYWCDAGRPTGGGDANSADGGFESCVSDKSCAASVVQGYMARYARDCNGDGAVNCDDYALMHRLGVVGCSGTVAPDYQNAYSTCMYGGSAPAGGGQQPGPPPTGNGLTDGYAQAAGYAQQPSGYPPQPAPQSAPQPAQQPHGGYAQPAQHPGGYAQPAQHPGGYAQPAQAAPNPGTNCVG